MDVLKSKTITTAEGGRFVLSGVNLSQIIKVCRQGIQYDYTSFLLLDSSNRCWSFITFGKRIIFKQDTPFEAGEKIFVIYKLST